MPSTVQYQVFKKTGRGLSSAGFGAGQARQFFSCRLGTRFRVLWSSVLVDLDLVGPASFFLKTWGSVFVDSEPANPASFYSEDLGPVSF